MPTSRTRSRSNHISRVSHSLAAEADRRVVRPAKRAVKLASRRITGRSGIPGWVPWVAGGVGIAAIIYGLSQIEAVRNLARSAAEPITDLLGDDDAMEDEEFEGESYVDHSDYGDRESGGL